MTQKPDDFRILPPLRERQASRPQVTDSPWFRLTPLRIPEAIVAMDRLRSDADFSIDLAATRIPPANQEA